MSRASSSARPLTLTEELEKLEQSITLTLQEIDSNFSRAHQIVTTKILPIVEQYGDHSKAVWEGSKFWKQFFEASANVSLSGVEEREEDDGAPITQPYDHTSNSVSSSQFEEGTLHGEQADRQTQGTYDEDESLMDNAEVNGSTPRAPPMSKPNFADMPTPYEALKQEIEANEGKHRVDAEVFLPTTPSAHRLPDMSMTPKSSPIDPTKYLLSSTKQGLDNSRLLHRILDKNYRVQATPLAIRRKEYSKVQTPAKPTWRDDNSPMSSPLAAAPELRADIFGSPMRQQFRYNAPRTPGVSVQPSAAKKKESGIYSKSAKNEEIDWESDSDEDPEGVYRELGMSPPKTIQFSLPQSRLLQTPAREASKRIVEDLLMTAGANSDDMNDPDSPSIVKMQGDINESF